MNQNLKNLRKLMSVNNWDAVIIPCADPHMSEYIPERWKSLSWISGFTGSAGNGIVLKEFAGVWTDSRYFIQAEEQMKDTGFELMKLKVQHAPEYVEWLTEKLPHGSVVAVVGSTMGINIYQLFENSFLNKGIEIAVVPDFWDSIWKKRPVIPANSIYEHELIYAGKSRNQKINSIRQIIENQKCEAHIISTLDDIAWTLNLRGSDIICNPVFLSHLFIDQERVVLFANLNCISSDLNKKLEKEGVTVMDYNSLINFVLTLKEDLKILLDTRKTTVSLLKVLPENSVIVNKMNPSIGLKSIKNEKEISYFKKTMEMDGVSMVKFAIWLENTKEKSKITEQMVVDKVLEFRQIHIDFVEPSFKTIAGYKEHGALPHYSPNPESDTELDGTGLFLLDSGGQYLGGTTDITRVFSIGSITEDERSDYTTVLKSLIALSIARFPKGTSAISLDVIARKPIWDAGKHYAHGTGHGVGYFLNVHEGPQAFGAGENAITSTIMEEGMVTTIEPGIYNKGRFGVRLENMIVTVSDQVVNDLEFLKFETITLCPFEVELIDKSKMTNEEIHWLNVYHALVFEKLSPFLTDEEMSWLENKTKVISFETQFC